MPQVFPFPEQSKHVVKAYMKQSDDATKRANLVISTVADAFGLPPGYRLDMSGEKWFFVPTEVSAEAEITLDAAQ